MKALDVTDLHSDIEEIQAKIDVHIEQLSKIEESVTSIVGLSDSLKGEGGTAIRRFYKEGHVPLLTFLKLSLTQYNEVLSKMKTSLHALEPAANGRIQESFLQHDVEQGLRQVELVTANLTNETNASMQTVSDLVALPLIRDDEVKHYVQKAKKEKDQTIEHLHQFDYEQAASLESVEADVNLMERYVQELQAMFQGKGSNVSTHLTNQLTYNSFYLMLNSKLAEKQTQTTQFFKQMYSPAYAINTTMTQAVTFDKWTNPSCPRPAQINKAVAAEPERNWFQKAGDQIVSGAKTVGKAVKDHSREIGSTVLDFTPIAGNIKAGVEAKSGVDPITKRELEDWEKYFAAAGILGGGFAKLGSKGVKGVKGATGKGKGEIGWSMSVGGGTINGRKYSQHALERMAPNTPEVKATLTHRAIKKAEELGFKPQTKEFSDFIRKYVDPRDIPPSVIEDAIMNSKKIPGNRGGSFIHETMDVKVIINEAGDVITVIPK